MKTERKGAVVASIGFFDGVHRGHQHLIDLVRQEAANRGMEAMLVTFDRHPREVVETDYVPQLLSSRQEKMRLLHNAGVERVEVLNFDREMSLLSAKQFMREVLSERLGVRVLVMGYDHRFGHGGGTHEQYVQWGEETGIEVLLADEMPGGHVSSSECRRRLLEGKVREAAQLLGHPYLLMGRVGEGHHVGTQIGFPTANVQPERGKVLPKDGAYAVWVVLPGEEVAAYGKRTENGERLMGMLNIGTRPTLDNGEDTSIEVNILDFEGDLYGKEIGLEFVEWLRGEQRFDSIEKLQQQLLADKQRVLEMLTERIGG